MLKLIRLCLPALLLSAIAGSGSGREMPPQFPISLPRDAAWIYTETLRDANGHASTRKELFITQGKRWRLEIRFHNGRGVVVVCDGKRTVSSAGEADAQNMDLRPMLARLYGELTGSNYVRIEKVGPYRCWYFVPSAKEDAGHHLWIDITRHIPRKLHLSYSDGSVMIAEFSDVPARMELPENPFDPQDLKIHLP